MPQPRQFDLSDGWTRVQDYARDNFQLLAAIAGVFVLIPLVVLGMIVNEADLARDFTTLDEVIEAFGTFYGGNWYWFVLSGIASSLGGLAMLALLLHPGRLTVGGAIGAAVAVFPAYLIAYVLYNLAVVAGIFVLIVPGIYFGIKFCLIGPIMIVEGERNPISALAASWRRTKGNSLRIFGFFLAIGLIVMVIAGITGSVLTALGSGPGLGGMIVLVLDSAVQAAANVVFTLCLAAVYAEVSDLDDMRDLDDTFA